jgi:hypothetical protein
MNVIIYVSAFFGPEIADSTFNAVFKRSSATSSPVFKTHSLLGGSPVYRVSRDFRASNLDIAIDNIRPKIWQNLLLW